MQEYRSENKTTPFHFTEFGKEKSSWWVKWGDSCLVAEKPEGKYKKKIRRMNLAT